MNTGYTQEQKEFILKHHGKMSRQQMAKKMHVSVNYLTAWAVELTGERRVSAKRKKAEQPQDGFFYHDENLATI